MNYAFNLANIDVYFGQLFIDYIEGIHYNMFVTFTKSFIGDAAGRLEVY